MSFTSVSSPHGAVGSGFPWFSFCCRCTSSSPLRPFASLARHVSLRFVCGEQVWLQSGVSRSSSALRLAPCVELEQLPKECVRQCRRWAGPVDWRGRTGDALMKGSVSDNTVVSDVRSKSGKRCTAFSKMDFTPSRLPQRGVRKVKFRLAAVNPGCWGKVTPANSYSAIKQ